MVGGGGAAVCAGGGEVVAVGSLRGFWGGFGLFVGCFGFREGITRGVSCLFSVFLGLFPPFRELWARLGVANVKRACSVGCRTSTHSFIIAGCQGLDGVG